MWGPVLALAPAVVLVTELVEYSLIKHPAPVLRQALKPIT